MTLAEFTAISEVIAQRAEAKVGREREIRGGFAHIKGCLINDDHQGFCVTRTVQVAS